MRQVWIYLTVLFATVFLITKTGYAHPGHFHVGEGHGADPAGMPADLTFWFVALGVAVFVFALKRLGSRHGRR